MQNRERGAAHINIYFFLVLLVLFLGTLWFGYIQMSQVNEANTVAARAEKDKLDAQIETLYYRHYVAEISAVVGERGKWTGKKDFDYKGNFKDRWIELYGQGLEVKVPEGIADASLPEQVKQQLENAAKSLGLTTSQATPIAPFLGLVNGIVKNKAALAEAAEQAKQNSDTQVNKLRTDFAKSDADNIKKLEDERQLYTRNRNDLTTANATANAKVASVQGELRDANANLDKQRDDNQKVVKGLNKEIEAAHGQMEFLSAQNSMRRPPQQADGSVISASMEAYRAWVDIGRKDMLLRGTKFAIKNPAGTKIKGYGEVISTLQDRAELRVFDVVDRIGDPITKGDQIYNDLYSPNMKRHVAMIGRFSYPYTKPMIKTLLERLGNTVHDEVSIGVDLVVVGLPDPTEAGDALKPIEETPGYKEALKNHCEIVTISMIRDLLQLN